MSLTPGTRLGPYDILAALGAGGMGEVYRAKDTKLDRNVALKILPEAFTSDAERLARFQREAKVLASLNHPNIAAIHGLEDSGETHALVLELVEGPSVADRIAHGPLPVDEALPIARQIAEALEAAHEQGIIHRDLKPANIKVTPDGVVKVLDFGLAKALDVGRDLSPADEGANSPTMSMTAAATRAGFILGTAAYMSPEQARGKPVDKRTDIWAFGVVLFEMLTGATPFPGEDVTQTLARVVEREPEWDALPTGVPPALGTYLRRCFQKDPRQRVRDVGDVRLAMDGAFDSAVAASPEMVAVRPLRIWQRPIPAAVVVMALAFVTGLAVWRVTRPGPGPVTRSEIPLRAGESFAGTGRHLVAISPDGRQIVYVTSEGLSLRSLDEVTPVLLGGTDGSSHEPFFSPDGRWIGFYARGQLRKVATTGGAPVALCEAQNPLGASWAGDDTILYGQGPRGIWRVSGQGGTPERLVEVDSSAGESAHGPQMLPGGNAVLFTLATGGSWDDARIVVQSLESGERKVVLEGGRDGRYVSTGHLVYARAGTLFAVPLDLGGLEVTRGPVPVVEDVSGAMGTATSVAHFSLSRNGSLIYVAGAAGGSRTLVWVDRQGREEPLDAPLRPYDLPRLSPDGTRVAIEIENDNNLDIHVYDIERGTLARLTTDPATDTSPVWTPDGTAVVFGSTRAGGGIFTKAADGSGVVSRFAPAVFDRLMTSVGDRSAASPLPHTWSADGALVLYRSGGPEIGDIYTLAPGADAAEPLFNDDAVFEGHPAISPDGRWIAYTTNENGRSEVYVSPFPNVTDARVQISEGGAREPAWGPGGRELFYRVQDRGAIAMVPVELEPTFRAGNAVPLFEGAYEFPLAGRHYDVAPDGERFLLVKSAAQRDHGAVEIPRIYLVQNWSQELLERVPVP